MHYRAKCDREKKNVKILGMFLKMVKLNPNDILIYHGIFFISYEIFCLRSGRVELEGKRK